MTTLTPETLAELRRLHEAATPAPWLTETANGSYSIWVREPHTGVIAESHDEDINGPYPARENLAMIAAMRNALPALLDAAEERDRLAERVRELEALVSSSEAERYRSCGELLTRATSAEAELAELQALRAEDDLSWADTNAENERMRAELTALRATIAAGEPFDADEVEAMRVAEIRRKLGVAVKALEQIAAGRMVGGIHDPQNWALNALAAIRDGQQTAPATTKAAEFVKGEG